MAPPSNDPPPSPLDPRALWRVLSAQRWLVAVVTAVVVAGTALVNLSSTAYWRATLRLLIERDGDRTLTMAQLWDGGAASDDAWVTQHKILESRAVAQAALGLLTASERTWLERQHDPVRTFLRLRCVQPVAKSRLVDVSFEHPEPAVAKAAVQALAEAFVRSGQERRGAAAEAALHELDAEARKLQDQLRAAQRTVQDFKARNGLVSIDDRKSLLAARLEKLGDELSEVERQRRAAESRLRVAESVAQDASSGAELPEVLGAEVIVHGKRELLAAQQEVSGLAQRYKAQHPQMLAAQRRVAAVEAQLRDEAAVIGRGLRATHEQLLRHEAEVRERVAAQSKELLDLEAKAIEQQILRDEADSVRRLYDAVLARLKEAQVVRAQAAPSVHRIGEPELSAGPVRPRLLLGVALALLGGLVLGGALAFGVEACDRSIKSAADASLVLGLPVLGLVPRLPGKRPAFGRLDPESLQRGSPLCEAFRSLRTQLAFAAATRDVRTLIVTSALAEEGKSLVAVNLALAYARGGKRVLLVDADLRRPRLHHACALDGDAGLSDALLAPQRVLELIARGPESLWVLPCGPIPRDPVELLHSDACARLLRTLTSRFDLVILDTPPAAVVSDACVLATHADAALLVVRGSATDRAQCQRALAALTGVGARVAGIVLNRVDPRAERYEGYGPAARYGQAEAGS